jgi:hypothetical protein
VGGRLVLRRITAVEMPSSATPARRLRDYRIIGRRRATRDWDGPLRSGKSFAVRDSMTILPGPAKMTPTVGHQISFPVLRSGFPSHAAAAMSPG